MESGKESIKVLVTIRHEENMQTVAGAVNRNRSVIPTVSADDTRVDAVAISDLQVVVTTGMMKLQTQHHKPVRAKISSDKKQTEEFASGVPKSFEM